MLTDEQLAERLRVGLERELAVINPDLRERLRTEVMRPDLAGHGRSGHRQRPRAGDLIAALGAIAALCLGVLVIVLLGHPRSTVTPGSGGGSPITRRLLNGDGLGGIGFGEPPSTVAAALKPLLGRPVAQSRARPTGLVPSLCGFSGQIEWNRPIAEVEGRSIDDDLVVYFQGSRFVGYSYAEVWTPYGPRPILPPHHRALLTTARGLTVDQPVTRGRQLYGRAFVQTTKPQGTPPSAKLPRLPAWTMRTATGELFGWLTSPRHARLVSIEAGRVPNTPCRSSARHGRS